MLKRKRLPSGREMDVGSEQGDVLGELLGVILSGYDDQQRLLQLLDQPGNGKGSSTRGYGPCAVETRQIGRAPTVEQRRKRRGHRALR